MCNAYKLKTASSDAVFLGAGTSGLNNSGRQKLYFATVSLVKMSGLP